MLSLVLRWTRGLIVHQSRLISNPLSRLNSSHIHPNIPTYLLDRTVPAEQILAQLTKEDQERLETIKAEYDFLLKSGSNVPSELSASNYLDLLCRGSVSSRRKYLNFRFKVEMHRNNEDQKKMVKALERQNASRPDGPPVSSSRIIRPIPDISMRLHWDSYMMAEIRCPDAAQPLIFDFSHESEMRLQDMENLASQMTYVLNNTRRMKPHPFHLILSSLKPETNQYVFMEKIFHTDKENPVYRSLTDLPWTITSDYYLDLQYPHLIDRPVYYLSPNARRCFQPGEWDHNAIYVIGAIVDKAVRRPVTFAKARRAGIETIRLPLERYVQWGDGANKTLTLICIHAILATAKSTNGDWETAIRQHLPKRCYMNNDPVKKRLSRQFAKI